MGLLFRLLNRTGLYNIARYSGPAAWVTELLTGKTKKEVAFYRSFLPQATGDAYILDVGANKGNKIKAFLKLGYRVVALEPERGALETLYYRYRRNPRVRIVQQGVSSQAGSLTLHVHDPRSGFNTLSDKWVETLGDKDKNRSGHAVQFKEAYEVKTTTLDALIKEYGMPAFIKIDVEGHELAVIQGLSQAAPALSFEANLPEFLEETKSIIAHLDQLSGGGYRYLIAVHEKLEAQARSGEELAALLASGTMRYVEVVAEVGEAQ